MTISIKRRSGGEILHIAQAFHASVADAYREKYAAVPVTVKKRRPMTIGMLLGLRLMQLKAQRIVRERKAK